MLTGSQLLLSGKRFAVAMWEYSWLVQRSGDQAEYADWDKVLDELVDRGYNCIRIDAYPHLIASDNRGNIQHEFEMQPISSNFMWGNHQAVRINPRQGLVEFMQKAKARGLYFGLSSWFNNDTTNRKFMVRNAHDYVRIWSETLQHLQQNDLLDRIIWVDICNEFPLIMWAPGAFSDIFNTTPVTDKIGLNVLKAVRRWKPSERRRFQTYLTDATQKLKLLFPDLHFTLSFDPYTSKNTTSFQVKHLKMVEPHIWATDDLWWVLRSRMPTLFIKKKYEENIVSYVNTCRRLARSFRKRHEQTLNRRMDMWAHWARKNNVHLVTSEGWVNVLYEDISSTGVDGEWDWFKDLSEYAVNLAIQKGWQGICTSNFAQPHFEGMWKDVAWHRQLTERIKSAPTIV
ncbi:MAG: cellulase-like family protein [Chloroflexota bacterium]